MLQPFHFRGDQPDWTDFHAIWPDDGLMRFGPGHACCGMAVGRNGAVVWEPAGRWAQRRLAAPAPLSGWSHIALVYRGNAPSVWINGRQVAQAPASPLTVHPSPGPVRMAEGGTFFNGDLGPRQWHGHALGEAEIAALFAAGPPPPPALPAWQVQPQGIAFFEPGAYEIAFGEKSIRLAVAPLPAPLPLDGPWQVRFPPDRGAPASIMLDRLASLHLHDDPGVRHFSGTARYATSVTVPAARLAQHGRERIWLDLGGVEVIAQVFVNGTAAGTLWTRPMALDITDALVPGSNRIEIVVTTLWPNRLIGDAALPDPANYAPGVGEPHIGLDALSAGGIQALPEWYAQGREQPRDGRVTFTTREHYGPDAPLLASGLIGPVRLVTARLHALG